MKNQCQVLLSNGEQCRKTALSGSYSVFTDTELYQGRAEPDASWVRIRVCVRHLPAIVTKTNSIETYETYIAKARAERKLRKLEGQTWVSDKVDPEEEELLK